MHPRDYSDIKRLQYKEHRPNSYALKNLHVLLHIDSFCLGDTICYASFIDEFVNYYEVGKLTISTFWPELFSNKYDIVDAGKEGFISVDKLVNIGFKKEDVSHVVNGMIWSAKYSMGLPFDTKIGRPPVAEHKPRRRKNKIVIAPESIKNIAKWNPEGWQKVVDNLIEKGFEIHNISYEKSFELNNVTYHNNNSDVKNALTHILESRIFIGLSSGLSWLAWAYDTPVVMISGFTKKFNEFDCFRVQNENCCTGCYNIFTSISNHCPIFNNTARSNECHKTITPDMVLQQVEKALESNKDFEFDNSIREQEIPQQEVVQQEVKKTELVAIHNANWASLGSINKTGIF